MSGGAPPGYNPAMALEREIELYYIIRPDLVRSALGRFVLIKGQELVGVFQSEEDALAEAVARFGTEPSLIRQVLDPEPVERL